MFFFVREITLLATPSLIKSSKMPLYFTNSIFLHPLLYPQKKLENFFQHKFVSKNHFRIRPNACKGFFERVLLLYQREIRVHPYVHPGCTADDCRMCLISGNAIANTTVCCYFVLCKMYLFLCLQKLYVWCLYLLG